MQFFLSNFLGVSPPEAPQNDDPKNQFFERLKLRCHFFLYQQILNRQIFCHCLEMSPLRGPIKLDPQK